MGSSEGGGKRCESSRESTPAIRDHTPPSLPPTAPPPTSKPSLEAPSALAKARIVFLISVNISRGASNYFFIQIFTDTGDRKYTHQSWSHLLHDFYAPSVYILFLKSLFVLFTTMLPTAALYATTLFKDLDPLDA